MGWTSDNKRKIMIAGFSVALLAFATAFFGPNISWELGEAKSVSCSLVYTDAYTGEKETLYNEDFARVNIFGVDTAGNIPSAYEACRRGLDEEVAEKQEQARQAEAEREARRRAEEERRRRAAEEARRQREEAERREQQQATRTTDRCAHVYVGKYFRLRTSGLAAIFGTGYAEYEVLGFSSSTGRVTARNLSSGNTFEIHCGDIP